MACALRLHELGLAPLGVDSAAPRRAEWEAASGLSAADRLDGPTTEQILVCVRTTSQAESVLAELKAEAEASQPGIASDRAVYVLTTLEPSFARELDRYNGAALRVIELPVSGGRAGARAGELTVLVGGGGARPEDVAFLKRTLAREVFDFPRFGDATLVKLINNTLATYNALAFASCLALADRAGLTARDCAEVILAGSGASWIAAHFESLLDDLLAKDAALLAAELGQLPAIDLSDPQRLLAGLAHGRGLLLS